MWKSCSGRGVVVGLVTVLLLVVCPAPAAGGERADEGKRSRTASAKYVPPKRGAPKVRISAASRGAKDTLPSLYVLAPDHVGLTVQASPRLYWHQSAPTSLAIMFTLAEAAAIEPLVELTLRGSQLSGQVEVDLADFGVSLKAEAEHRWVVAIVPDPNRRSRDVIAEGRIRRVSAPEPLKRALAGAPAEKRAAIYAKHGIWYDALAAINDAIHAHPQEKQWRHWRSGLLREVELSEPAASLEGASSSD